MTTNSYIVKIWEQRIEVLAHTYTRTELNVSLQTLVRSLVSLLWHWLAREILGNIRLGRQTRLHTVILSHSFME